MANKHKAQYFKPIAFVDEVMKELKLDSSDTETSRQIREEILFDLGDRIMATVFTSMDQREIKMFEQMLNDHPELDPIDVLMIIAPQIDGLKEKLEHQINSLYGEMVHDAERIRALMMHKNA